MKRPTPPKEAKVVMVKEVADLLRVRYPTSPDSAMFYVLNMFTTFDLVNIRGELKETIKRNGKS